MHLSNEELLEPNAQNRLHLAGCTECKKRLDRLEAFRTRLSGLEVKSAESDIADLLVSKFAESKPKRWMNFHIGIAAAVLVIGSYVVSIFLVKYEINDLIIQSKYLQQSISSGEGDSFNVSFNSNQREFWRDIAEVDAEIQKAYLEEASDYTKRELWKKRITLLKRKKEERAKSNPENAISI